MILAAPISVHALADIFGMLGAMPLAQYVREESLFTPGNDLKAVPNLRLWEKMDYIHRCLCDSTESSVSRLFITHPREVTCSGSGLSDTYTADENRKVRSQIMSLHRNRFIFNILNLPWQLLRTGFVT